MSRGVADFVSGERPAQVAGLVEHQDYRLWQLVLQPPAGVHVHPVSLLPVAGGDPGAAVRHAYRHVESRYALQPELDRLRSVGLKKRNAVSSR